MKLLGVLSVLTLSFVAVNAHAGPGTSCSNADGTTRYVATSYNRGIPPRNGDVLSTTQVIWEGQVISEEKQIKGEPVKPGRIISELTDRKVLRNSHDRTGYTEYYSAKLKLSLNPAAPVTTPRSIHLPTEVWVICVDSIAYIP